VAKQDAKIRQRLFPKVPAFDRKPGGFVPLPIVFRALQFLFQPRAWQLYCYIAMRAGPESVAWFPLDDMAWDLDFKSVSKLRPYIDGLVEDGWIVRSTSRAREYFMLADPGAVIEQLVLKKRIPPDRLEAINDLLEVLGRPRPELEGAAEA
jgi:hypothetical protein